MVKTKNGGLYLLLATINILKKCDLNEHDFFVTTYESEVHILIVDHNYK